ncbi:MAG: regulatory protein RecX [Candidatus Kapaibacteriota bacterium]
MASIEQSYGKNTERIISTIKAARKKGKCFIVFTNGDYILIEKDIVYEFQLAKGQHLSISLYHSILEKEELIEAKKKGLSFATYAIRSTFQVKNRLIQSGFSPSVTEQVIAFLKEFNYLSDEEYATQFTKAKIERRYYGYQRLKIELVKKGISHAIIDKTLKEHYPDSIALETARKSADKKLRSISFRNDEKKRAQLHNHLFRQGYSLDIIKTIIEEYFRS